MKNTFVVDKEDVIIDIYPTKSFEVKVITKDETIEFSSNGKNRFSIGNESKIYNEGNLVKRIFFYKTGKPVEIFVKPVFKK